MANVYGKDSDLMSLAVGEGWERNVSVVYLPYPGESEEVVGDGTKLVKEAIRRFHKLQEEYKNCGAIDSEPYHIFRRVVRDALEGKQVRIPNSVLGWQLYSGETSNAASVSLTRAAREVVRLIGNCRLDDVVQLRKEFN